MKEHVNNSNVNTISTKSAVLICKIITQMITKYGTTCLLTITSDCLHLVDGTKRTRNDSSPYATPQVTLFIDLYIIISVMS